ncbi:MAG: hypothetical protein AAGC53_14175 [Actinomycetota bacterium]
MSQSLESRLGCAEPRPASVVMQPEMLGAVRPTRYSFSRSLIRRAITDGWKIDRTRFDIDGDGQGVAVYQVDCAGTVVSFIAITQTLPESAHTDRVIADRWEITAALVAGVADDALIAHAQAHVTRQERGRLDPRFLVLTRGNRSVRFFDRLVGDLARGEQPDPESVGDSAYIMRSTAFYANGKYGMRSFDGYPEGHPLAASYRAQFLAAFLYRELSYDVVEHCARVRGGDTAVGFDDEWRRFFGLGNATGLGLVPYFVHHPRVINAWVGVRELALAEVRATPATDEGRAQLSTVIDRARHHFASGTTEDCTPFLSPAELVPHIDRLRSAWLEVADRSDAYDAWFRSVEHEHPEAVELAASALIELHDGDDRVIDELLLVDESSRIDHDLSTDELVALIDERFGWVDELDLDADDADAFWWVISDNTDEPRRTHRARLDPDGRDVAIDVALLIHRVRHALRATSQPTVGDFLDAHPEHRAAIARVFLSDRRYGEARDNTCAAEYLPLQLQRFQLAMYGMDNYKPKSTDWLRVTLFQGAPRADELSSTAVDDWFFPVRPALHA